MAVTMSWAQYQMCYCRVDGKLTKLTPKQADVLFRLLVAPPGHQVSPQDLLEFVYPDPDLEPDYAENCLVIFIHQLRMKGIPILNLSRSDRKLKYGGYHIAPHARVGAPI
jgi:hypothetical protein